MSGMAWKPWRAVNVSKVAGLFLQMRGKGSQMLGLGWEEPHRGMLGPPREVQENPSPRGALGQIKPEQPASDVDNRRLAHRPGRHAEVPPSGDHLVSISPLTVHLLCLAGGGRSDPGLSPKWVLVLGQNQVLGAGEEEPLPTSPGLHVLH